MVTENTGFRGVGANGGVEAILFDLDGTLIDTTDLIFRSYQHAFRDVLGTDMTREELYLGFGQPLPEAFASILARRETGLSPADLAAVIDRLVAVYRAFNREHHDDLAREFIGAREVLAELSRRGYRLGLVTSKTRDISLHGLRLVGLEGRFETAVFMEDSLLHKPHPDPILVALGRLGLRDRPGSVIYVGDSTHDVIAGRAAGTRTGAALWGPFPPESLRALAPTYTLGNLTDLLTIL